MSATFSGGAFLQETERQYVQVAQAEIDPAQLENYLVALREQIEAAIREEPGVLVLYAVSDIENPARLTVFEIYKDTAAYKAHLEICAFQEIQSVDRDDGEVACACSKHAHHARHKKQMSAAAEHLRGTNCGRTHPVSNCIPR